MPALVLIAGGSCSGKTTLASELERRGLATHVPIDRYYRSFDHLPPDRRRAINFDDPGAIEADLLASHVDVLLKGQGVSIPTYDYAAFERKGSTLVTPSELIIVEGLFALAWPVLRQRALLKVFVDTAGAVCLRRRILRDTTLFGRSQEDCLHRFIGHVQPAYHEHVRPTSYHADMILDGSQDVDVLANAIQTKVLTMLTSA